MIVYLYICFKLRTITISDIFEEISFIKFSFMIQYVHHILLYDQLILCNCKKSIWYNFKFNFSTSQNCLQIQWIFFDIIFVDCLSISDICKHFYFFRFLIGRSRRGGEKVWAWFRLPDPQILAHQLALIHLHRYLPF